MLTFNAVLDYENPTDRDEDPDTAGDQGKGDNVYKVTVKAIVEGDEATRARDRDGHRRGRARYAGRHAKRFLRRGPHRRRGHLHCLGRERGHGHVDAGGR